MILKRENKNKKHKHGYPKRKPLPGHPHHLSSSWGEKMKTK